jgi:hypothetical protein
MNAARRRMLLDREYGETMNVVNVVSAARQRMLHQFHKVSMEFHESATVED